MSRPSMPAPWQMWHSPSVNCTATCEPAFLQCSPHQSSSPELEVIAAFKFAHPLNDCWAPWPPLLLRSEVGISVEAVHSNVPASTAAEVELEAKIFSWDLGGQVGKTHSFLEIWNFHLASNLVFRLYFLAAHSTTKRTLPGSQVDPTVNSR